MKDTFTWSVAYADGTSLQEYDESRQDGRGWADIGEKPVRRITLMMPDGSQMHHVMVPTGVTPMFFRRRSLTINPASGQEENRSTVHCIGWKQGESGTYLFVRDDGETLLTSELQAV